MHTVMWQNDRTRNDRVRVDRIEEIKKQHQTRTQPDQQAGLWRENLIENMDDIQ